MRHAHHFPGYVCSTLSQLSVGVESASSGRETRRRRIFMDMLDQQIQAM
jgi:hypothetical protein